MKKRILLLPFIALVLFTGIRKVTPNEHHNRIILSIVISYGIPHLQSEQEIDILKRNKIKSMSLVERNMKNHNLDSLTFLEYDKEGRIIRRTTKECTTFGCLPYMNREVFSYKGNKIIKMKDYLFRYKEYSTYAKWTLKDTSRLNMFDWEDYSYKKETIRVESGSTVWKYIKGGNGNIVKQVCRAKSNNQLLIINYNYNDSIITASILTKFNNHTSSDPYIIKYIADGNQVLIKTKNGKGENLDSKWVFNSKDLPVERITYKNGKIYEKTKISYAYYE